MKAQERIVKYGVQAYIKMRGLRQTPALVKFYTEKYPSAPVKLPATHQRISRHQKAYWSKIKQIAEGHEIGIKEARKIFKRERKEGRIKLVKQGRGYQLCVYGIYRKRIKEDEKDEYRKELREGGITTSFTTATLNVYDYDVEEGKWFEVSKDESGEVYVWVYVKQKGHSYVHSQKEYEECFEEAIREAKGVLGGTNWELVEVIREEWYRFYGRERSGTQENNKKE